MENRKIRNATEIEQDGIKFRSKLELRVYNYLKSVGINPKYEPEAIVLWEGKRFTVPYYDRYGKRFMRITRKPASVKYTPDFIFEYNDCLVYLEVKGFKNDVANYKIKLFRDWLEGFEDEKLCYAVVYTIRDVKTLLEDLHNSN